jgi:hypothetical protein
MLNMIFLGFKKKSDYLFIYLFLLKISRRPLIKVSQNKGLKLTKNCNLTIQVFALLLQ